MGNYHLAIDIGASSGRCILGWLEGDRMVLEEVHRFANRQVRRNGHDCWDLELLWQGILAGLKACRARGKIPATIGIDTWAVDFVLLDPEGRLLGDAVAYRDSRTEGMDAVVERLIPAAELYAHTGIQKQSFNTIYQLAALQAEHPDQLARARSLLMIPDYFNYLLTGVQKAGVHQRHQHRPGQRQGLLLGRGAAGPSGADPGAVRTAVYAGNGGGSAGARYRRPGGLCIAGGAAGHP